MTVILSIDPGASGALAIFTDGQLTGVLDMPLTRYAGWPHNVADARDLRAIVERTGAGFAVVETIMPRPGNGMKSVAASAVSWGALLGALCDVRLELVTPMRWTKALNVGSDKNAHRAAARNLFGGTWFDRVRDDGRADAALIGHWWISTQRGKA